MTTTYTWAIEAAFQTQLDEQAAPTKAAGVPWA